MTNRPYTIHQADCLDAMRAMDMDSIDAVVTDPPYGIHFMGRSWDAFGGPTGRDNTQHAERGGAMHAGKYDLSSAGMRGFQAFSREWASEAIRVLKPGGHLLSFASTRTYHRMTCGIEEAGFEIRDCILWLYGSGFPKSLDVSKAIDRRRNDEPEIREVCRFLRAAIDSDPEQSIATIASIFGFHPRMVEHWAARDTDSQPSIPTWEQWERVKSILRFGDELDGEVWRLNGRKGEPGEAWHLREKVGEMPMVDTTLTRAGFAGARHNAGTHASTKMVSLTQAHSAEARAWDGWGTALKPACEPIVVARKPLAGTGGLNIDACRIGYASDADQAAAAAQRIALDQNSNRRCYGEFNNGADSITESLAKAEAGRWPANVVLDEIAARVLDKQTHSALRQGAARQGASGDGWGLTATGAEYDDAGGASRFFYVAKPSRAERDAGLAATVAGHEAVERQAGSAGLENPRAGAGRTADRVGNPHPTVKPVALMRHLVCLVTPPGGVVLDPFTGSGTTGIAACVEGFRFVGCERESDYVALIHRRLEHWLALPPEQRDAEQASAEPSSYAAQVSLFDLADSADG